MLNLGAWPPIWVGIFVVLFVVVSCLLMIIVLLQRPQGGGLSEAFGASGAGAGNTAFGARVGDALTTATVIIFIAFIGIAIALNFAVQPGDPVAIPTVGSAPGGSADGTSAATGTDSAAGQDPLGVQVEPIGGGEPQSVELVPVPDLSLPPPDQLPDQPGTAPSQDTTTPNETPPPQEPDPSEPQ